MERPKREDFDKICRLCLKSTNLVNIFERNPKTQTESLSTLVRETVEMLGLAINPTDPYPRKICISCKDFLRSLHKFRQQAQEANDLVKEVAHPESADQEMAEAYIGPAPVSIPEPQFPTSSGMVVAVQNEPTSVSQKSVSPRSSRLASLKKLGKAAGKVANQRRYTCNFCGFSYASPNALSVHMYSEHPSPNTCEICNQQFRRESNLINHKIEVHRILPRLRGS